MKKPTILPFGECFVDLTNERTQLIRPFTLTLQTAFQKTMETQIAKNLWPDIGHPKFNNRPNVTKRHQYLTLADLAIMQPLMQTRTTYPNICPQPPQDHLVLFKVEDLTLEGVKASFSLYLYTGAASINQAQQAAIGAIAADNLVACNGLLYRLKMKFQRMRPFQAAYLSHALGFEYQGARSAYSPSLPSGHCLSGVYAACRVFEAHLERKITPALDSDQIERLQQLAVDIGDRRVMAGVHYPTDNIASWYCMASLIPHCFPNYVNEIKEFLKRCIEKSAVWIELKKSSDPHHANAVKWLAKVI